MPRAPRFAAIPLLAGALLFLGGNAPAADAKLAPEAMRVLQKNCLSCHGAEKQKGGLSLANRELALKGGDSGPSFVAKKPESSAMIKVLAPDADPHMPPKKQLAQKEIDLLSRWIAGGAAWDEKALTEASRPREVTLEPARAGLNPVYALAVSADGARVAFGRGTNIVVIDPGATNVWGGHSEMVRALAWSSDGKHLASGSFKELTLWEDGKAVWTTNAADRVTAIKFAPGSTNLAYADASGHVTLLGKTNWSAHADGIHDLAISADGKLIATAGNDKLAKVWDAETFKELAALEGHAAAVTSVAFNTNATELLTVGLDKRLTVWDFKTRESIVTVQERLDSLAAAVWVNESKTVFAATDFGAVWRFTDFKRHTGAQSSDQASERKLKDFSAPLHSIAATPDGKKIYVGGDDGIVRILDSEGKELGKIAPPAETIADRNGPSFVNEVLPALAKAGCMAGSCHAKPEGQNGFKLSVFSYDPATDYHEIVREGRGRRVFPSAPGESLILLKPTAAVEHGGGERIAKDSETYRLIERWIRAGMPYMRTNEPTLAKVTVEPADRAFKKNAKGQLRVQAHFSDGSARDVTALAEYSVNDKEIAQVTDTGVVSAGAQAGETVVVARYMGKVAPSRVTIPSERKLPPEQFASLPIHNYIDELAYKRFRDLGLFPSDLCTDAEFIRRATLDTIGRLPTVEETRAFIAENAPLKRARLIERLLNDPLYADYWANKWADLLRPNPDRVGVKSIFVLDQWLRESFRANMPYDQFVRAILTAEGSNHRDGPAVVYRDKREPQERTTMVSQLFLGTRMECAKCHHHPSEKWSQDDFYQFAAFFGPVGQKGAGLSPPISAGMESFFFTKASGNVKHPVTGAVMKPRPLDGPEFAEPQVDPRQKLADWLLTPENPFFARAAVNRLWANFFGRGFVEPVDDFRVSNPIVNEPLLDALASDFAKNGYDFKKLIRTILNSRLYQLSSTPNETNLADTKNFSRSYRRRLPAEVLLDAINDLTGATDAFNGCPPGTRAIQTWSYKVESHFMDAFSRPNPSSDAPCERDAKLSVVQSLHLMNAIPIQQKLAKPEGRVKALADSDRSAREIINELYLAAYSRSPSEDEAGAALKVFNEPGATRQAATEDVLWALINSPEFVFNR